MSLFYMAILMTLVIVSFIILVSRGSKNLLNILVLIAFSLPFERIPTYDLGGTTLKINHILGLILIALWLVDWAVLRKRLVVKNILVLPSLLLMGVLIIATIGATFTFKSLLYTALAVFTISLAVITVDLIRDVQSFRRIEKVLIASAWLVVFFSAWQFIGDMAGLPLFMTGLVEGYSKVTFGFPRVQAFSKEPLYLGNFLLLPLGISFARLLAHGKISWPDRLLFLGLVATLFLTLSRGALLGLVGFGIVIAIIYPAKVLNIKMGLTTLFGMVVVFGLVLGAINLSGEQARGKFIDQLTIKDYGTSESTVSRLSSAQEALRIWSNHPFFGIGMGNFGGVGTDFDADNPKSNDIVNNEYLELLAETGIVGFGSFVILISLVLTRSIGVLRKVGTNSQIAPYVAGLTAALAGMLIQYNFFSTLSIIYIWFTIGLLVACQNILIKIANKPGSK